MQKFGEGSKPFKTYYAIFGGNAYSFTFVTQTVLVWTERNSMRSNSYPYGFVGKYTPHVDGLWQFFPTKITILGGIRYCQAHAIFVLVGYISFLITSLLNPAQKPYCCYIPIISKDTIGFNPTIYIYPQNTAFFSDFQRSYARTMRSWYAPWLRGPKKTRRCRRVQWEFMLSRHEKSWLVVGAVCIYNHIYIYMICNVM